MKAKIMYFLALVFLLFAGVNLSAEIPLYWWQPIDGNLNFGDELSIALVEKIVRKEVNRAEINQRKLLAIGSILHFARDGDIIWGAGINGKHDNLRDYHFRKLDIRSVRGPLTYLFLKSLGIKAPKVFGDPALLMPIFFPEFKVKPVYDYVVIPHISEMELFSNEPNVILPTEHWSSIVKRIVESRFVISSSLHGIVVAEAYGIPARLLRVTNNEPLFKYADYYQGTGRRDFRYATSIKGALEMGGEAPIVCDLTKLLSAFPFELF